MVAHAEAPYFEQHHKPPDEERYDLPRRCPYVFMNRAMRDRDRTIKFDSFNPFDWRVMDPVNSMCMENAEKGFTSTKQLEAVYANNDVTKLDGVPADFVSKCLENPDELRKAGINGALTTQEKLRIVTDYYVTMSRLKEAWTNTASHQVELNTYLNRNPNVKVTQNLLTSEGRIPGSTKVIKDFADCPHDKDALNNVVDAAIQRASGLVAASQERLRQNKDLDQIRAQVLADMEAEAKAPKAEGAGNACATGLKTIITVAGAVCKDPKQIEKEKAQEKAQEIDARVLNKIQLDIVENQLKFHDQPQIKKVLAGLIDGKPPSRAAVKEAYEHDLMKVDAENRRTLQDIQKVAGCLNSADVSCFSPNAAESMLRTVRFQWGDPAIKLLTEGKWEDPKDKAKREKEKKEKKPEDEESEQRIPSFNFTAFYKGMESSAQSNKAGAQNATNYLKNSACRSKYRETFDEKKAGLDDALLNTAFMVGSLGTGALIEGGGLSIKSLVSGANAFRRWRPGLSAKFGFRRAIGAPNPNSLLGKTWQGVIPKASLLGKTMVGADAAINAGWVGFGVSLAAENCNIFLESAAKEIQARTSSGCVRNFVAERIKLEDYVGCSIAGAMAGLPGLLHALPHILPGAIETMVKMSNSPAVQAYRKMTQKKVEIPELRTHLFKSPASEAAPKTVAKAAPKASKAAPKATPKMPSVGELAKSDDPFFILGLDMKATGKDVLWAYQLRQIQLRNMSGPAAKMAMQKINMAYRILTE